MVGGCSCPGSSPTATGIWPTQGWERVSGNWLVRSYKSLKYTDSISSFTTSSTLIITEIIATPPTADAPHCSNSCLFYSRLYKSSHHPVSPKCCFTSFQSGIAWIWSRKWGVTANSPFKSFASLGGLCLESRAICISTAGDAAAAHYQRSSSSDMLWRLAHVRDCSYKRRLHLPFPFSRSQ